MLNSKAWILPSKHVRFTIALRAPNPACPSTPHCVVPQHRTRAGNAWSQTCALTTNSLAFILSLHSLRSPATTSLSLAALLRSFAGLHPPPSLPLPQSPRSKDVRIGDGPAAVAKLIKSKVCVTVLLAFGPTGRHVICAALRTGLLFGRQHAWVLMGHNPGGWWNRSATDTHDCSNDELLSAVQGYLAVDRDGAGATHLIDPTGEEPKVWLEKYRTRSGDAGVTVEGVAAYDAVWTWAYALHELLYTQGVDVTTLTADKVGRTKLFDALVKQDFYGASGRVYFDPVSGDRRGLPVKVSGDR